MCVCVCVCVCDRLGGLEGGGGFMFFFLKKICESQLRVHVKYCRCRQGDHGGNIMEVGALIVGQHVWNGCIFPYVLSNDFQVNVQ